MPRPADQGPPAAIDLGPGVTIRAAHEGDRARWDAFVAGRAEADVLQLWAWGEAMRVVGRASRRILAERSDGSIAGLAAALVEPARFGPPDVYVPHGPVWQREAPDAGAVLAGLVAELTRVARSASVRAVHVQVDPRARSLREHPDPASDADAIAATVEAHGFKLAAHDIQARSTQILEVAPTEAVRLSSWAPHARNLYRRAFREGTTVVLLDRPDDRAIETFYRLLTQSARRGHFRIRPEAFYGELARELGPGGVQLAIAAHAGSPVAAMFVAIVGDRAFYLYAGMDRDAAPAAHGGYAVVGQSIAGLAARGVRSLDLWGVADESSRRHRSWSGFSFFKSRFGGRPLRHPGLFEIVLDRRWSAFRTAVRLARQLTPAAVAAVLAMESLGHA